MRWKKLKHLFVADGQFDWMHSHGSNAVFRKGSGDVHRVYFSCRDAQSRGHIAYVDIDFKDNFKIVSISNKPVLSPGGLGYFDDSGVIMGCFADIGDELFLYYLGWNLKVTVPWQNSIGLAKYHAETDSFVKVSKAPVLDRSDEDPFSISYPSVIQDGAGYRMWYGSNLTWGADQKDMMHVFKHAHSEDGVLWNRDGRTVVALEHENEIALSKPWVIKDHDCYRMWYSYRGNGTITSYRIGYAESADGIHWERKDNQVGIDVSVDGWDSNEISYPCVFDLEGKRYMLYNGNDYGQTGFGIAVLE